MPDNPQAKVTLSADDSPLRQSLREMVGKFREFGNDAQTSVGGVTASARGLQGMFVGVAAALTGGVIANFLRQTVQLQDEMSKAAQKAGVTTEQFSGMNYAAKLADVSTEQLTKTYAKLNSTLVDAQSGQKDAVELFRRLKLDPKNIKDADELLLSLAERFEGMKDGAKKTALAVDIFGEKLGPGLIPFLNQGRGGIKALREEAAKLGLVIGTEQGKQAEEFNDNLTKMGKAATGAGNEILKGLLPSLTEASAFFVKATKEAGLFQGTLISIGALMARGLGVDELGKAESRLKALRDEATRLPLILADAEKGLRREPDNPISKSVVDELRSKILLLRHEILEASAEVARLASGAPSAGAGRGFVNPPLIKGSDFEPGPKKPDEGPKLPDAPASYMQYYEAVLAEEKRAQSTLTAGREYTKEEELAFWRFLADNLTLTTADKLAFMRKTAGLEVEISRKAAQDRTQIDADAARTAEQFALGKVDAEALGARMALDLGAITKGQLAALEIQFEQQRYAIQASALQERLRLVALDPTLNPVEMARLQNEILLLEQQHQNKRLELFGAAQKEGGLGDALTQMFGSESTWSNLFNGLIAQTLSWRQAMGSIFSSTGQVFINEVVTKPFAAYAGGLARQLAAKLGFLTAETAAQGTASEVIVGEKEIEAQAVVSSNAAEAGSGAAASVASIPYIGPALALAAMASIFAAVSALGARSAARGYDIPRGVNPMTQLHEEEMVLPSPLANAVRRMAEAGDGPGAASAGPAVELRGASAGEFFIANRRELLRVLGGARADFALR